MAAKRKRKRDMEGMDKPTKEEYAVAKFLRFNVPSKEGKLVGMTVQYFLASKAVDALLESKWGSKAKADALFSSRAGCVDFCDRLLQKGIFHRAARVEKKKDKDKPKKKKLKEGETEEGSKEEKLKKEKKSKKGKEAEKEKEDEKEKDTTTEAPKEKEAKKEDEKKDEEKKKKKKIKLEMHDQQIFKDGDEYYVWIYDPVPLKTFLIGLLLVLGAIAVCLFPLWPPEVRLGVYYLSLAAAGFVGFILSLCVIRMVMFCIVWGVTFGKHHFWFLPNLTEDVGFFDSFRPLYKHDIMGEDTKEEDDKDKASEGDNKSESSSIEKTTEKDNTNEENENKSEQEEDEKEEASATGSEGDNDNGYEIVDPEDLTEQDDDQDDDEPKKTK